jgi:transposase InsO family protein
LPAVHEDLVHRRFTADAPDRLWCTDITEHPTSEGKVYCCAVLDVFSRAIVGWSIADHMRTKPVVDALEMATWRRRPQAGAVLVFGSRGRSTRPGSSETGSALPARSGGWAASHPAWTTCNPMPQKRTRF